ncbi:MAG TPA: DUF2298 domain-containing protein [Anaerolineae bacterium]|nr:DUF2298 domain-containing protein [Anaerolineae bacterium]
MFYALVWWFLLVLIGFAALPVTLRFLRFLPDRGYAFAKPLGLLVWVYPFWLLTAFGFLQNSFGVLAAMLIAVAVVSWGVLRGRGSDSVVEWLRANWRYVVIVEVLFGIAYLGFAFFRAYNPEITATEKPMEYMFLNSILQSSTFPPRDAWLSGYSISYYYLGYVIVAAIAKLGNIPSSYAFNLGLTMTFALAAVGAFGLIFNVVRNAHSTTQEAKHSRAPYVFGVIAVFLLLIVGNLEGVFEAGYNAGIGSRAFYASLDLHGLEQVQPSGSLIPEDNWWWWRASRVVNDKNPVDGSHVEVIDEFPAFSFLLGDLHPHVLALPFGILALAVALNLLLKPTRLIENTQSAFDEFFKPRMLLTVLIVGALGMLNTWDIATYGILIAAAFAIAQYRVAGRLSSWVVASSLTYLVLLFVGGYVLFLPFYLTFSSQARGIAPNILNRTPLHQYLIMFGLFVFVIASFVILLIVQRGRQRRNAAQEETDNKARAPRAFLPEWVEWVVLLLLVPVVVAAGGLILLTVSPALREQIAGLLGTDSQNISLELLQAYAASFLKSPGVFVLLVALLAALIALGRQGLESEAQEASTRTPMQASVTFAILLALVGLILTFGVEFLYIRDTFEDRMNTVFKLYYQAWLLFAMAATFGTYYIWQTTRGAGRSAWLTAFGALFALSLVYPALAVPNRANYFESNPQVGIPTLDGWAWVQHVYPDDYAAIEWVRANVPAQSVILEAVGDEYSFYNRVSGATGLPTVLGWGGHELQWRGNYDEAGPRERDVAQIYQSRDINMTRDLLEKYQVDYVVVGSLERDKYDLNQSLVDKFGKLGELVFEQGSMRIYHVGTQVSF